MKEVTHKMHTMEISPVIIQAIEIMRSRFGGTKVILLSKEMYRKVPDEFTPLGKLGVDIEIEGIKTFLGCESMAEDIVGSPYGNMIADEIIYRILYGKVGS